MTVRYTKSFTVPGSGTFSQEEEEEEKFKARARVSASTFAAGVALTGEVLSTIHVVSPEAPVNCLKMARGLTSASVLAAAPLDVDDDGDEVEGEDDEEEEGDEEEDWDVAAIASIVSVRLIADPSTTFSSASVAATSLASMFESSTTV